jgi:preprotein translocase subunit SecA
MVFATFAKQLFGSANDRYVKNLRKEISHINALESHYQSLSDEELKAKTSEFKTRLSQGATLNDLLYESFACVREAAKRLFNMRPFDVQLMGGIVLHRGMIAEMRTGEGKTLMATLPSYLNALTGNGVHIVTVNDYLATRDAQSMGKLYQFLGLTVGCITSSMRDIDRQQAYKADITYGTNNEFGFDYLRDNMRFHLDELVQRPFSFAIIDEVDSILIDEARTPLIISGPTEDHSELYIKVNQIIPLLRKEHIEKDEKSRTVFLTEEGSSYIEDLLHNADLLPKNAALYDIEHIALIHHVNQALRAHHLFSRDVDYMVRNDKLLLIDEFTGRIMDGRRYSDGLHQALEAKEHVTIQSENQTLASITFQNYFRLYPKLSGMTGTAMTEANEFHDIYRLNVVEIPTNVPIARIDDDDEVYQSEVEKYDAIVQLIETHHAQKQPILVGTVSIEKSEKLSQLLTKKNIPHNVLNAKYHEQEADIIAQAGRLSALTIATNMAGRGTDIMLGGNKEKLYETMAASVEDPDEQQKIRIQIDQQIESDKQQILSLGGLLVIGTERHESRRIDNQLRGRCGRQGDPGKTKFYLSLQDDLMRIFGSEKIANLLSSLGLKNGEAIHHPLLSRSLAKAQQRVEARNYEIRKNLLKYDDVMNEQRKVVYEQRIHLMKAETISDTIDELWEEILQEIITMNVPNDSFVETWNQEELTNQCAQLFGLLIPIEEWVHEEGMDSNMLTQRLRQLTQAVIKDKRNRYSEIWHQVEKRTFLGCLDHLWKEHLYGLEQLRQGINLRAYGQKDPLNEYKREAFHLFSSFLNNLKSVAVQRLAHTELTTEPETMDIPHATTHQESIPTLSDEMHLSEKIGRNTSCPCGSGKKFKHCHGKF